MEKELAEMNKPTHKGRAVKVVEGGSNCDDCIFANDCDNRKGNALKWEIRNNIKPCFVTTKKYIYA